MEKLFWKLIVVISILLQVFIGWVSILALMYQYLNFVQIALLCIVIFVNIIVCYVGVNLLVGKVEFIVQGISRIFGKSK